jgi:hypothetical protein
LLSNPWRSPSPIYPDSISGRDSRTDGAFVIELSDQFERKFSLDNPAADDLFCLSDGWLGTKENLMPILAFRFHHEGPIRFLYTNPAAALVKATEIGRKYRFAQKHAD